MGSGTRGRPALIEGLAQAGLLLTGPDRSQTAEEDKC